MKIQVVHLEPHDDLISTRDKMGWGQTSRIILILPTKGMILERPLDLILLQRHSLNLGAQLSLVTREESICFYASQLGIPTFPTLRKAQSSRRGVGTTRRRQRPRRSRWAPRLEPREPLARTDLLALRDQAHPALTRWRTHPAIRLGAFCLSMLALLSLVIVLVPGASIKLDPRQQTQNVILPITASVDFEQARLTGEVPAHWVSVIVEGRDSIPASGKVLAPEKAASGTVRFTNLTSEIVEIPKGTVVRTIGSEGYRFVTTQSGRVAAGVGRYAEIGVRALMPGAQGNVVAHTLQLVEGNLGLKVSCTNSLPLRGGSDQEVPGPSETDRKRLFDRLAATLQTTAEQELTTTGAGLLGEGDFPILPSLTRIQVLEEKYLPEAGIPAERLELTLRLEFQVMVAAAQDLHAVATPILSASLPEGYAVVPGTLKLEAVRTPRMIGEATARWDGNAIQAIQAVIPAEAVIQAVRGQPVDQVAAQLLATFPLADQPQITVRPSWWFYLPFVAIRIEVN